MRRGEIRYWIALVAAALGLASFAAVTQLHARQAKAARGERGGPPTPAEMKGKTAGEFFKNIKVLKDVPADQVVPGMRYITIALGVHCSFCHNTKDFSSDAKRPKKTARLMMSMLFSINKNTFKGHPVIGCYTCHRGSEHPVFAPMPAVEAAQPAGAQAPPMTMVPAKQIRLAKGTPLPTVEQVLAKYAQALGGSEALASVRTREISIEQTTGKANAPATEVEIYEKAPNKFLMLTHGRRRTMRSGYDGTQGWVATPRGPMPLSGMDAQTPMSDAQIDPAGALAGYTMKKLRGMAQIGDQKTYVMNAQTPDGEPAQLYFDAHSGLLVRRVFIYRTIFGPLMYEADYSNYQKDGGVLMPLRTEWWAGGSEFTETVKSVKTNVPISDARFQPPPKPPARNGASGRR